MFYFLFSVPVFYPFFPFGPSLLHSVLFSYYISSSHLSIFLPPTPDVIATEKRPLVEKGVRLAGPPSHLARRGGGGGGRSSGSMFESKPSPPPPLTLVTSDPAALPSGPQVELWGCMRVLCHWFLTPYNAMLVCDTPCRPSCLLGNGIINKRFDRFHMLRVF